jgi:hypothetical protein
MAASVDFIKGATNRYRSVLDGPNGVDVGFEGGSYNKLAGGREVIPPGIAHWDHPIHAALTSRRRRAR